MRTADLMCLFLFLMRLLQRETENGCMKNKFSRKTADIFEAGKRKKIQN
jgi:hypothetical protein